MVDAELPNRRHIFYNLRLYLMLLSLFLKMLNSEVLKIYFLFGELNKYAQKYDISRDILPEKIIGVEILVKLKRKN